MYCSLSRRSGTRQLRAATAAHHKEIVQSSCSMQQQTMDRAGNSVREWSVHDACCHAMMTCGGTQKLKMHRDYVEIEETIPCNACPLCFMPCTYGASLLLYACVGCGGQSSTKVPYDKVQGVYLDRTNCAGDCYDCTCCDPRHRFLIGGVTDRPGRWLGQFGWIKPQQQSTVPSMIAMLTEKVGSAQRGDGAQVVLSSPAQAMNGMTMVAPNPQPQMIAPQQHVEMAAPQPYRQKFDVLTGLPL